MGTQRLQIPVLVGLLILAFAGGACTRSASTPPPLPGTEGAAGQLTSQQATMEAVRSALLTQTAQAEEVVPFPTAIATEEPSEAQAEPSALPPTEESKEPTVVVSTPQSTAKPGYTEYVVQVGDWVYSIARDFAVDPQDIIDINGLAPPYSLEPGDILKIPPPGEPPPEGATLYRVQAGDTVFSIARKYGIDPQALIEANGMAPPYTLHPGDKLVIP